MQKTHPAADAGLVRLGAGMRRAASPAPRLIALPAPQAVARPVPGLPAPAGTPAHVADAGRVRLGAGMRRV